MCPPKLRPLFKCVGSSNFFYCKSEHVASIRRGPVYDDLFAPPVLPMPPQSVMAPKIVLWTFLIFGLGFVSCFLPTGENLYEDFLPYLTPLCLGCICEATTNCNLTIGCQGRLCGPFFISREYWEEAGSPVIFGDNPTRRGAYETCVNEPYCAAQTLKQYVYRHAQDCNGNGVLDCDDYARIHYLGGRQCYLPIHRYGYYKVFRRCDVAVQYLN